jgi:hypothetical protein
LKQKGDSQNRSKLSSARGLERGRDGGEVRVMTHTIWADKLREECTNVDGGMLEQEGKSRVWQPWTCMDRSYLM